MNDFKTKVLSIVAFQTIVSFGISFIPLFVPEVQLYIYNNSYVVMFAIVLFFINLFSLYYNRLNYPLNYVLLGTLTLCDGYLLGLGCSAYNPDLVFKALGITSVSCVGLTIFTCQIRNYDLHWMFPFFFSLLIICCIASILHDNNTIIASCGSVVISWFFVYDTWNIVHVYDNDEYMVAVIDMYLNIVNLFFYILELIDNDISII